MLRLTKRRRDRLADKLPDTANVALGILAFSQFLSDSPIGLGPLSTGIALWFVLMAVAFLLEKE
jgi:hypothetical protein